MLDMQFYWWRENGRIVVQNMLMGLEGQKHSHTEEEFRQWAEGIPPESLHEIKIKQKV